MSSTKCISASKDSSMAVVTCLCLLVVSSQPVHPCMVSACHLEWGTIQGYTMMNMGQSVSLKSAQALASMSCKTCWMVADRQAAHLCIHACRTCLHMHADVKHTTPVFPVTISSIALPSTLLIYLELGTCIPILQISCCHVVYRLQISNKG